MKEAGFMYVVRFWVAPQARGAVMGWLEGGHVAEVVGQPGFLWCRQLDLGERDERGWAAYAMIYGIESGAAFDAYRADAALAEKFAAEREPFARQLRMERWGGSVVLAVDRPR
ncbi:MAG: hypothetical protein M5U08_21990 [Burkholderiales bacterium]|nr:hypothetical protein [Burkholderiales bacterium]